MTLHDQDHAHAHAHAGSPEAITRAIVVTVVFMLIEFAGGLYANSLALLSDSAHMLTDVGALLLSLFALWIARRPATPLMSWGFHRAEILGALASGIVIWILSGFLIYEAILRLQSPPEVHGPVVFFVALVGLAANLLSMRFLHGRKHANMNVRAAYLHLLSDALGSVGAVAAGAVLWWTGWRPIDPIITVIFSGLMIVSSWSLVKETLAILMESTPAGIDPAGIRERLQGISGVREAHDLHVWTVASGRLALSVHLIATAPPEAVLNEANDLLQRDFGIIHTTIQVEHPDRFRSERCYDCAPRTGRVELPTG